MVIQFSPLSIDSIRLEEILDPLPLVVKPETWVVEVLAQMNQTIDDHCSIPVLNTEETAIHLTPTQRSCALVEDGNRLVGIFRPKIEGFNSGKALSEKTIAEVMTPPPHVLLYEAEYQNIFTVLSLFSQHQIDHLPVLNAEDKLIGLITKQSLNEALNPVDLYSRIQTLEQKVQQLELENQKFLRQQEVAAELRIRAKQQEAIANLSQQALSLTELDPLLDQAVSLVAHTLEVPYSQVLELLPNEAAFLLRKGIGSGLNTRFGNQTIISASQKTQAGYTLSIGKPVIVTDLRVETRFRGSTLLHNAKIISGVTVIIPGKERPFGVLGVHSPQERIFSENDINFLQAIAKIIASTLERLETANEFNLFFNLSVDLFCIAGVDGYFKRINPQFQSLLGYSETELLCQPIVNFVHPEDRARTESELESLTQGIPCRDFENRYRCKDGSYIWLSWTSAPFEQGRLYAIARDITEQKRFEQDLQASQRRYATLAEVSPVGIFHTDTQGEHLYVNQRWCEIAGLSPEEALRNGWREAIHPEDQARVVQKWSEATQQKKQFHCEYRFQRCDGTIAWVYGQAKAERSSSGVIVGYVGTITDISDRKLAELALQNSEAQYRQLINTANEGIWSIDTDNKTTFVNPKMAAMLGYTVDEMQGKSLFEFMETAEVESANYYVQRRRQGITEQHDFKFHHKNGRDVWTLVSTNPILNPFGQYAGALAMVTNITERKETEIRLQESKQRYTSLVAAVPVGIFRHDSTGNCIYINDRCCQITGLTKEAALGDRWQNQIYPQDRQPVVAAWEQSVQENRPFQLEYRFQHSDGTVKWVYTQAVAERDAKGNVIGYVGTITDISDRKLAELERQQAAESLQQLNLSLETQVQERTAELQEQKQFLQTVFDSFPLSIFWKDCNSIYLGCNRNFLRDAGLSSTAELRGKTDYDMPWGETKAQEYCMDDQQVITSDSAKIGIIETQVQANGQQIWVETSKIPLHNLVGEVVGIVGTYQDITDRKQAEEQLRLSERAIAASSNGIVLADARLPDYPLVFVNSAFEKMTGYSASEVLGKNCRFLQGQDHNQSELDVLRTAIQNQDSCTVTLRNYHKDGRLFWNQFQLSPIYDEQGNLTHFLGIQNDITQIKLVEERLQNELQERQNVEDDLLRSQQRLQYLLASTPGVIYSIQAGLEYKPIFVSENVSELLGYPSSELYDRAFWISHLHPEDRSRILENGFAKLFDQDYQTEEYRFLHADGSYHWIYDQLKLVRDTDDQPIEIIGYWIDISDRKQSERKIQSTNEQLQAVLDAVPGFVSWVDSDLRYLGVNHQLASAMNRPQEDFIGQKVGFLDSYSSAFSEFFAEFFQDPYSHTRQVTLEVKVGNENRFYLLISQKYDRDRAAILVGIDITERKQIEEQLRATTSRLSTLIENLQLGVLVEDENQKIVLANQTFCELLKIEISPKRLVGQKFCEVTQEHQQICWHDHQFYRNYQNIINQQKIIVDEEIILSDGRTFERDYVPIEISNRYQGHLWMYRDISERKEAENQLKTSLQEKEILLKEIHHRVKNNLFVVANLLEFQSDYFDSPEFLQALEDSRNRVYSMALIHEKLYQSTRLDRINFDEYLEQLLEHLLESYSGIDERVEFESEIEPLLLNIETAHPCGLIVNELISNVFKHAFPNDMTGKVGLKLNQNSEGVVNLEVKDNGIGFPEDLDFHNVDSLGMELICTLTTQLEGNLELILDQGTTFKLTFSELKYKQRY